MFRNAKKLVAVFLCVILFTTTATTITAEPIREGTDGAFEQLSVAPEVYFNALRRGVSIPEDVAFQLFRVQLALSLGMDLNTFLFGDVVAWVDDFMHNWRLEHGISIISYEGDTVGRSSETGVHDLRIYSMATGEFLGIRRRIPEEIAIQEKTSLLRVPYVFMDRDGRRLEALMESTLGILSVEELLSELPLQRLENEMHQGGLTFLSLADNWVNYPSTYEPAPHGYDIFLPAPTPAPSQVDDVLELMDIDIRRTQGSRVTNTSADPFRMVVNIRLEFADGTTSTGTGFLVRPTVVMTASHVLYCHNRGLASSVQVIPGRNGHSFPFNSQTVTSANLTVQPGWVDNEIWYRDWGTVQLNSSFTGINQRFWMAVRTDQQLRGLAVTSTGFPGWTGFMYTGSGSITSVGAPSIVSSNDIVGGYSGGPLYDSSGWVVGITVRGGVGFDTWSVRITSTIYNWVRIAFGN
jgi:V8-like Glu-specific endopeptidase